MCVHGQASLFVFRKSVYKRGQHQQPILASDWSGPVLEILAFSHMAVAHFTCMRELTCFPHSWILCS